MHTKHSELVLAVLVMAGNRGCDQSDQPMLPIDAFEFALPHEGDMHYTNRSETACRQSRPDVHIRLSGGTQGRCSCESGIITVVLGPVQEGEVPQRTECRWSDAFMPLVISRARM